MKRLTALFAALILLSCSNETTTDNDSGRDSGTNESSESADGTLYMRTSMFGSTLNIAWFWIGDDGVIVRDPVSGADPIDLSVEKAKNGSQTGSYKINGDRMEIQWADGKTASWRVETDGDLFKGIDGGVVTVPKAMPSDYKLNGSFTAHEVAPNVSAVTTIHFNPDGTFSYKSSGAVTVPDEDSAISTGAESGTYTISGNTLTMKFQDGREEKSLINILELGGTQYLIINQGRFPVNQ